MKKLIDFFKSEGSLCMLITFLVCSFIPGWIIQLVVMVILIVFELCCTRLLDTYKLGGFISGWLLAVVQHFIF